MERSFALILDRGGMRRVWLRGRENVQKRYLIHVAGYNLGLIMRLLTGAGTPREFQSQAFAWFIVTLEPDGGPSARDSGSHPQSGCHRGRLHHSRRSRLKRELVNGLLKRTYPRCRERSRSVLKA